MIATNSYRCELFFSALRKYSRHHDTRQNSIYAIKRIILKQILDDKLKWHDAYRQTAYDYTNVLDTKTNIQSINTDNLINVAN